jgi:hypothetical protein
MKKKIISMIGLALFVGAVAFNVNTVNNNEQKNEVMLKNIEALAGTIGESELTGPREEVECASWPLKKHKMVCLSENAWSCADSDCY